MKLPTIKKIMREDLKDAPNWISSLIDPLNTFMENVYQALNRSLTFSENIASSVTDLTYRTSATYPSNQDDYSLLNPLKTRPSGVMLLQAYERSNYTAAPGPVYVPWVLGANEQIVIKPVTGLEAGKTYILRLVIL